MAARGADRADHVKAAAGHEALRFALVGVGVVDRRPDWAEVPLAKVRCDVALVAEHARQRRVPHAMVERVLAERGPMSIILAW